MNDRHQRQRRAGVSAPSVTEERLKNWTPPCYPKSEQERRALHAAIDNQKLLFGHLSPSGKCRVADAMFRVTVPAGQSFIQQGTEGDNFYVIQFGEVQFLVARDGGEAQVVGSAGPPAAFGELALLYGSPRAATVLALQDLVLWALDRDTFQMMLATAENTKKRTYEDFLENIDILKGLNKYERVQLCDMLKRSKYRPGECIVKQGDKGDKFYVVEKGEAVAVIEEGSAELVVCKYSKGGYFGELALIGEGVRRASVYATTKCNVLSIDRPTFDRVLGPIRDIFTNNLDIYRQALSQKQAEWFQKYEACNDCTNDDNFRPQHVQLREQHV